MADIITKSAKGNKTFVAKLIRIDLTPMVDLGFLLITFFVFTSALSEPKALGMVTPKDSSTINDEVCETCAITILPANATDYWYYEGMYNGKLTLAKNGIKEVRNLLAQRKQIASAQQKTAVLIIKPTNSSNLNQLVKLIDESKICAYPRYYLDEPKTEELAQLMHI
jgi:biopolymer transport protein ExbD